ncbi:MAG: GNAT family N-acetyltransferase [Oscillospiraceae bacterium]|nr:GNAT family N-acetyltransferase [Oscillospiraceae bacterium]
MKFIAKTFDALSTKELYEILKSRMEIFMLEQEIHCLDMDNVDYESLHCFLWDGERVCAYLRAYEIGEGTVKLGRVLSLRHGEGFGRTLMENAIPTIKEHFSCQKLWVDSQCHASGFYAKLNFSVVTEEFLEEGIPHVGMERSV